MGERYTTGGGTTGGYHVIDMMAPTRESEIVPHTHTNDPGHAMGVAIYLERVHQDKVREIEAHVRDCAAMAEQFEDRAAGRRASDLDDDEARRLDACARAMREDEATWRAKVTGSGTFPLT